MFRWFSSKDFVKQAQKPPNKLLILKQPDFDSSWEWNPRRSLVLLISPRSEKWRTSTPLFSSHSDCFDLSTHFLNFVSTSTHQIDGLSWCLGDTPYLESTPATWNFFSFIFLSFFPQFMTKLGLILSYKALLSPYTKNPVIIPCYVVCLLPSFKTFLFYQDPAPLP